MKFPSLRKPPPPKPDNRRPRVVFQPGAYAGMLAGIDQMVNAVRPTLGPRPRLVAIDRGLAGKQPELFDNGGLIARRIVALPDRDADMGAMLVRKLLWRQHEDHGDGTATAAVLFQVVYRLGVRHVSAGGNAMRLRAFLEEGVQVITAALDRQIVPQQGRAALTRLAEAQCYDPPLAAALGEIFDGIGPYGQLEIVEGRGRELAHEFYPGSFWRSARLLKAPGEGPDGKVTLTDAAVLLSDVAADDPQAVAVLAALARQRGAKGLMLVVKSVSEPVRALLLGANRADPSFPIQAAETPGQTEDEQIAALADLAALCGGRPLARVAGETLASERGADLGRARTIWVDRMYLGVTGGRGDPRAARAHLGTLQAAEAQARKPERRAALGERIGRLASGAATLWIGAATEAELQARRASADRTVAALRGALREGTLPGGGAALLASEGPLRARLKQATDPDEQAAYRLLLRAIEAPLRVIVENAGGEAPRALAAARVGGCGWAIDVRTGRAADMQAAGIVDVAPAYRAAVQAGILGAALALTVDVLVQHRKPTTVYQP